MKYKPKTKPFAHQAKATLTAVRKGNLAFLMEPGTGKTKAVLDAIAIQALRGKCSRVAVLCPLSALGVWEDQLEEHYPLPYLAEDPDFYWNGNQKKDGPNVTFYLLNYEKVSRRNKKGSRWVYPYVRQIEDFRPDIVVLDESHRCKRASTNRSRALWYMITRLRKLQPTAVYLMSGTPNPKGYIDLFAQYRIMDPTIFGTSKAGFEERYCIYGYGKNKYRIVRYRNKKQLLGKIRQNAFIRTKNECLDLPPVMPPTIVKVPLPVNIKKMYLQMVHEMVAEIEGGHLVAANAGVKRLRLRQITGGFLTDGTVLHDAKITAARERLEDLYDSNEPVIVLASFLPEVDALALTAEKVGYRTTRISGETKRVVRDRAIRSFQEQSSTEAPMALVFQVDTGSLSITLTRSNQLLFYSLPDSWDTYWQAISREDRIGQTRAISHQYLLAPGTVDMSMLKSLRDKRDMHAELMGNPEGFLLGI